MRSAPLLFALALVACDAKDAPADAKKAATKPAAAGAANDKAKAGKSPAASAKPELASAKPTGAADSSFKPNDVVLDHTVKLLDGSDKSLADYRGKALLVVNTASECGYTPQYADLQEVYAKYKDQGLEVLAFPSNDFGQQEPGDSEQIREFVDSKYSVQFEMFDKVHASGPDKSPIYTTLTEKTGEGISGEVKWNFTKFLVDPEGKVIARFESATKPTDAEVIAAIERALPKS